MGLTSITIENFKGIGAPVTVPLRPITLLFGANSAGKSTIIQALQYAWEVLENRNPDVDRTRLGGEVIDLGGFRNLVHQHDLERSIKIMLEFRGALNNKAYLLPEIYYSKIKQGVCVYEGVPDINEWSNIESFGVQITTTWDAVRACAVISKYEVAINEDAIGHTCLMRDGQARFRLSESHPMFSGESLEQIDEHSRAVLESCLSSFGNYFAHPTIGVPGWTREELVDLALEAGVPEERLNECSKEELADAFSQVFDARETPYILTRTIVPEWGRLLDFTRLSVDSETAAEPEDWGEEQLSIVSQIIVGTGETILNELRGLRYLGPLRKVPDRLHAVPLRSESARWADGLGAWDALLRGSDASEEDSGPSLVDRCSDYLHDTLGLHYTLRREDRIHLPANGELFARLKLMANRFEETEGDELRQVVSEIEALNRTPVVQLHDEKNDVDVNLMDIGVGVSQTLPVVVGAVEPNCTLFAVEQPELHIHPAVQVNLADIFLREILEEGKKPRIFLLETHSEHLVLRIMRRMRETCEGTLPDGFPQVTPEDVAVLYVEPSDTGTQIIEIPITEEGEFDRPWPKGFFPERAKELM